MADLFRERGRDRVPDIHCKTKRKEEKSMTLLLQVILPSVCDGHELCVSVEAIWWKPWPGQCKNKVWLETAGMQKLKLDPLDFPFFSPPCFTILGYIIYAVM